MGINDNTLPITDKEPDSYQLFNLHNEPLKVTLLVNQKQLQMEIDTGAALSLISEKTFKNSWCQQKLKPSNIKLHTYTKESIDVLGFMEATVCYKGQNKTLNLYVVGGEGPSLMGRDWLTELQLDWRELYLVNKSHQSLQEILNKHSAVFKEGLGEAIGIKANCMSKTMPNLVLQSQNSPSCLKKKVEQELQRLTDQKSIEPVQCLSGQLE